MKKTRFCWSRDGDRYWDDNKTFHRDEAIHEVMDGAKVGESRYTAKVGDRAHPDDMLEDDMTHRVESPFEHVVVSIEVRGNRTHMTYRTVGIEGTDTLTWPVYSPGGAK